MFVAYNSGSQILRRKDKGVIHLCSKKVKKVLKVHHSWYEQNPKSWGGSGNYQLERVESVVASAKKEGNEEQGAGRDLWEGLRYKL